MSVLSYRDQLIHYEAVGRGAPIVFIHSWFGSWRYWWPAMQSLSHNYRTFAFDLWGFGSSSRNTKGYSMAGYVAMLHALVEGLGMSQPVTLVGHALGAAVAIRYASQYPNSVARLATVALPLLGDDLCWRPQEGQPSGSPLADAIVDPQLAVEIKKADSAAITCLVDELKRSDLASELVAAPMPRLVIAGDTDPFVRPPNAEILELLEDDLHCCYLLLSGVGHFPMLERTATFNRLLKDFVRGLEVAPKLHWQRRAH